MNDQNNRSAPVRYIATGALAALAAAGAIAGTAALAANPQHKTHAPAAVANGAVTKTPTPPGQNGTPDPGVSARFLAVVQRLVDDGTISSPQGQIVDREILAGRVDTQTLAASGFTPAQLQAVQQALSNTKRALAAAQPRTAKDLSAPARAGNGKSSKAYEDPSGQFLAAVQRLVNDGRITNAEGQVLDREILAGGLDAHKLAASGFTPAQLEAIQHALSNTKRAIAEQTGG